MPSGLPGKAWDLIVDVHNGHPERCGGGQVPAVSHSHEKTEAVRVTFQVQETGLLTQPQRKRASSLLLLRHLQRLLGRLPALAMGLIPSFLSLESKPAKSYSPHYNVPAMDLFHSPGIEAHILLIHSRYWLWKPWPPYTRQALHHRATPYPPQPLYFSWLV